MIIKKDSWKHSDTVKKKLSSRKDDFYLAELPNEAILKTIDIGHETKDTSPKFSC